MLHLRIYAAADTSELAVKMFSEDPAVSGLAVLHEASIRTPGDVLLADVAREAANDVIDRLRELGVQRGGAMAHHAEFLNCERAGQRLHIGRPVENPSTRLRIGSSVT